MTRAIDQRQHGTARASRRSLSYVALALSIGFGAAGQLLMKWAATTALVAPLGWWGLLEVGVAVGVYCLGIANWVFALRTVSLSLAYPLSSLTYVGVLAGSHMLLGEEIGPLRLAGVALIFTGVLLVVLSHPEPDQEPGGAALRNGDAGTDAASTEVRSR
jgi:drug/metabolite transporter (DMT)-like permease